MRLDEPQLRGSLTQVLARVDAARTGTVAAFIALALSVSWLVVIATEASVLRELYYVPVILAAVRFGLPGTIATATLAGLLAGPWSGVVGEPLWTSASRTVFYLLVGALVALVVHVLRSTAQHQLDLERGQRDLEAQRGTLVQAVSHEFRTPLTVIRGVAATFDHQQRHMDPVLRPLVASLNRASRRLDNLVTVVMAAADALSDDHRTVEAISLTTLFDEVTQMLEGYAAETRLRIDLADDARTVVTAPSYVKLIVYTLLENALKFSPEVEPVDVASRREGATCVIVIRDRGVGISDEELQGAFDPFRQGDMTTTRRFGGLGLGLYTAQRLAEAIAADVSLRPHPERGTVATLVVNEWLHPHLGGSEAIPRSSGVDAGHRVGSE